MLSSAKLGYSTFKLYYDATQQLDAHTPWRSHHPLHHPLLQVLPGLDMERRRPLHLQVLLARQAPPALRVCDKWSTPR